MNKQLGFIGCGNIAGAMIRGIVKKGTVEGRNIAVFDIHGEKTKAMSQECGVRAAQSAKQAVADADFVFVCVEPSGVAEVAEEIKGALKESAVVISPAAGVSAEKLSGYFGPSVKTLRIMPNLPITVGAGMTMICATDRIGKEELETIRQLILSFGNAEVLDEKYVNAFTACASSSPAMVFMLIEAMADAAVLMGLTRAQAYAITAKAVEGSAKMVSETGAHPAVLKDRVCSPGGTTIEMVASLEQSGLRGSVIEALDACHEKCELLSRKK